jgi:ribosomal protein L11 methyltransferase
MNQPYTRYVIVVPNGESRHLAIHFLADMGLEGFEETDTELIGSGAEQAVNQQRIEAYLQDTGLPYTRQTVANENWNALWESSFEPVVVDDFVAVRADFHAPVANVEYELIITPKMSFGTGHHATTHLMMGQMRHLAFGQAKVLDFGTGTGILAILAEKLGAAAVLAVDIDDWCVENAQENADRNECRSIGVAQQSSPPLDDSFDVVLANINKHILLAHMAQLARNIRAGGVLLMSGILQNDGAELAKSAEREGLMHHGTTERQGWLCVRFRKTFR